MNQLLKITLFCIFSYNLQMAAQPPAIEVSVHGKGSSIILLGGFATDAGELWQATIEQLYKDYKCHVIHYAGFAGMPPIDFPWIPQVVSGIENYIIKNQIKDAVIVGHSLGGTLGIQLAANPKLQIKKLLIVDALPATGALMMPDFKAESPQYNSPYNNQILAMNEETFAMMAGGMAAGMSTKKESQEQIKQWMVETDRKTYVYAYTDYLKFDARNTLSNINIPVNILAAGKPYGAAVAQQTYDSQYKNLRDYDLYINEDSAHFIMMDQSQWFIEHLQSFLK